MASQSTLFDSRVNPAHREEILVTVKAYPNPSTKYIETVCVAGLTRSGDWIRLYPIPFRFLDYDQQFHHYEWIEADIFKSQNDPRPESFHIGNNNSIKKLGERIGTSNTTWDERKGFILPHISTSIESLRDENKRKRTSLGMIKPKQVTKLIIKKEQAEWDSKERAKLQQHSLLDPQNPDGTYQTITELEKIPYRFQYEFTCDDARCTGHKLSIISWEVIQSYRKWLEKYGGEWESKFRQKYEIEFLNGKIDLHFFVGNLRAYPNVWNIIGLFYPPYLPPDIPIQQLLF